MHFGRSRASLLWRSLATGIPLWRLLLCHGAPASSIFAIAAFPACLFATAPQPATLPLRPSRSAALPQRPGQQHLPDGTLPHCSRPAAPPRRPGQQLRYGAPASNKPHLAEKSTPVWLAIWRTWAGFANSQLRCATFRSTYEHICAHPHCCHLGLLLKQTQISRPICTDCLRHLRISAR